MRLSSASSTLSRGSRLTMPTMPHIGESSAVTHRARGDHAPPRCGRPDELPAGLACSGRDQRAANNRREEFPGQPARDPPHALDRHRLEAFDREYALLDQPVGAAHRHPVEPALDLGEPGGSVGFEIRPPPDEGGLREDEMGPGEQREKMAHERMEPGWSERDHNQYI